MNKLASRIFCGLALLLVSATATAQDYELPKSATAPVITLDFRGDRLQRIDPAPSLSILSDGTVLMPRSYAHTRAYVGKLTASELQDLLDFIIKENEFLGFHEPTVAAKLAAVDDGRRPNFTHAVTTIIGIALPAHQKTVAVRQLGVGAQVRETEQLLAIEDRLERLMSIVKLGGTKEARNWLEVANGELAAMQPGLEPLVMEDLRSAAVRSDGSFFVQFVRDPGAGFDGVNLAISAPARGDHQIAISRVAP